MCHHRVCIPARRRSNLVVKRDGEVVGPHRVRVLNRVKPRKCIRMNFIRAVFVNRHGIFADEPPRLRVIPALVEIIKSGDGVLHLALIASVVDGAGGLHGAVGLRRFQRLDDTAKLIADGLGREIEREIRIDGRLVEREIALDDDIILRACGNVRGDDLVESVEFSEDIVGSCADIPDETRVN